MVMRLLRSLSGRLFFPLRRSEAPLERLAASFGPARQFTVYFFHRFTA